MVLRSNAASKGPGVVGAGAGDAAARRRAAARAVGRSIDSSPGKPRALWHPSRAMRNPRRLLFLAASVVLAAAAAPPPSKTITLALKPAFFFKDTAATEIYTLSLHDALPI